MTIVTDLCRALCDSIQVEEVPLGLAVSTGFSREDGDTIAFYVVRDSDNPSLARLEDDGETIPYIEASGVDIFSDGPRSEAFHKLLDEYGAEFDADNFVLQTPFVDQEALPGVTLKFTALLLRVQDFLLITRQRVEDTFKADALRALEERFVGRVRIETDYVFNDEFRNYPVDVALIEPNREPLGVFIGTSEPKALEALLFYDRVTYMNPFPCKVLLVLDSVATKKITPRTLNRVVNQLPIAAFRGEKELAMRNIERRFFDANGQRSH